MSTYKREQLVDSNSQVLLPRNVAQEIWDEAKANSIVPSLARQTPIIIGENTFPVVNKRPAASIIGQGGDKKDSEIEFGSKTITPIKAQVGLEFTMEAIEANPVGVMGLLSEELGGALARQVDLAVLHGKEAATGSDLSGTHDFINDTSKREDVTGGGYAADQALWDGYGQVVDDNHRFSGFAFDERMVYLLATARDNDGRRLNPEINMGSSVGSYAGLPVSVSKTVSGNVDAVSDQGTLGFGGDWDALRFGYSLNISVRRIDYGDPFGNGDLARRNASAFLSEVIFGWAIMDLDAFVAYDNGS